MTNPKKKKNEKEKENIPQITIILTQSVFYEASLLHLLELNEKNVNTSIRKGVSLRRCKK